MYGQLQIGGACYTKKELFFPTTISKISDINPYPFINKSTPLNKWIGLKFIFREYDNVLKTNLQMYMDLTNCLNGGTWKKINDFTDRMGWSGTLANDIPQDSIEPDLKTNLSIDGNFWNSAPICAQYIGKPSIGISDYTPAQVNLSVFIRNDYKLPIYGAQFFKWFSIREINELHEL